MMTVLDDINKQNPEMDTHLDVMKQGMTVDTAETDLVLDPETR